MKTIKLGQNGPTVSAIGLGSLSMGRSGPFGASGDDDGIRTIHAALDRGVTLLDTADFYGSGDNEALVGRALAGHRRDGIVVSVKFGAMRDPAGKMLGLDSPGDMSIARHVVTQDHDQFRLELIRAFDDSAQLFVVDKPVVGVDVSEDGDSQTVEFPRPVVDRDRLLANNQPARFDQDSPKDHASKK